jgi:hypothetical protein
MNGNGCPLEIAENDRLPPEVVVGIGVEDWGLQHIGET